MLVLNAALIRNLYFVRSLHSAVQMPILYGLRQLRRKFSILMKNTYIYHSQIKLIAALKRFELFLLYFYTIRFGGESVFKNITLLIQ